VRLPALVNSERSMAWRKHAIAGRVTVTASEFQQPNPTPQTHRVRRGQVRYKLHGIIATQALFAARRSGEAWSPPLLLPLKWRKLHTTHIPRIPGAGVPDNPTWSMGAGMENKSRCLGEAV
jgi:hypothetical protein